METFTRLFGSLLAFVYHCFDRIVLQGYLPLLTRPEHIVHFFRDVHGIYPITKQVLAKRTDEYQRRVEAFARNHHIPIQWPTDEMKKKGIKKEDYVRSWGLGMERRKRFGVYFIFKSMEQGPTFLRLEICVNRLKDLGLNKGLENLNMLRRRLVAVTDRMAGFEAELLNVHVDFPLFQRLALPILSGRTKIPGIKIHDTRMMRLMEVLLHGGTQLGGWRTAQIHEAIRAAFDLSADAYILTQLRYDLRKMKGHGLLERDGRRYCYRLTEKGKRVAAMFVLFHKRICGPLANSLFHHQPEKTPKPPAKIEAAYHRADDAIQKLIHLLAAERAAC